MKHSVPTLYIYTIMKLKLNNGITQIKQCIVAQHVVSLLCGGTFWHTSYCMANKPFNVYAGEPLGIQCPVPTIYGTVPSNMY